MIVPTRVPKEETSVMLSPEARELTLVKEMFEVSTAAPSKEIFV